MPFTLPQTLLYTVNSVLARVLWRAQVQGRVKIPPGQGAVIICNHRGPIDPSFIQLSNRRVVHWMVAKEYCESRLFGWFLRTCEVIPVSRGGVDTAATKAAIRYAQQGGLVGLFPEGRIDETAELLLPGRPGAALIALKGRVPVVPCFLEGSPNPKRPWAVLVTPARARLVIGDPLDLSEYYGQEEDRAVLEELTRRFLREIARLGGRPDFAPRLAGRSWVEADKGR